ncbi:MAG: hypothetical protein GZ088_15975 [Acidipila sp.]|nr:hypothetical protein [Acidipila sp.]
MKCKVYWGSHGCQGSHGCCLESGHKGPHRCECADDPDVDLVTREFKSDPGVFNVGAFPYYGPETNFYGEDVRENEFKLLIDEINGKGN